MGGIPNFGPSPTLELLGPPHQWCQKSRVSLRGPPRTHGVSGIPHGEMRNKHNQRQCLTKLVRTWPRSWNKWFVSSTTDFYWIKSMSSPHLFLHSWIRFVLLLCNLKVCNSSFIKSVLIVYLLLFYYMYSGYIFFTICYV